MSVALVGNSHIGRIEKAARLTTPDTGMVAAVERGHGLLLIEVPAPIEDKFVRRFLDTVDVDRPAIGAATTIEAAARILDTAIPIVSGCSLSHR